MLTHNLGYPRIGSRRELKLACEQYWANHRTLDALLSCARELRARHWSEQKQSGLDLIPCNDFSLYDQTLDLSLALGAIPSRYLPLVEASEFAETDLMFAMARGIQRRGQDVIAMEMTKWFDTNYHYIVPELVEHQSFSLNSRKAIDELREAIALRINPKPVLVGPVTYLLLARPVGDFRTVSLIDALLPAYSELLSELHATGAEWVQLDEPFLCLDLERETCDAYARAYAYLRDRNARLNMLVATYFGGLHENTDVALSLPVAALHLDLIRGADQLERVLQTFPKHLALSCGLIDGRNVWRSDFTRSLRLLNHALERLGADRVMLAPSCSLLHVPYDVRLETGNGAIPPEITSWLAFARQKLDELQILRGLTEPATHARYIEQLKDNILYVEGRKRSPLVHRPAVKERVGEVTRRTWRRASEFSIRRVKQQRRFKLPAFPTTTIGSFPQTPEIRRARQAFKSGAVSADAYTSAIEAEIRDAVQWQEHLGIDVLVHGEFERNDMVEYFGEQLDGFAFSRHGWVQSYGSRCVKPPIIFGDVSRRAPITVTWSTFAASLTHKPIKGMVTGPVTILQWSFVRDDQPRRETAYQIALAIHDEVLDLEGAGIGIIQIDEAALREGLPLRRADRTEYLDWAVRSFHITCADVSDETQIHTHMCYSKFSDIIRSIADMDADVITIETSRSQMQLLDTFAEYDYPNEIGPGVYDIHSPRVPSREEIVALLEKAAKVIPADRLWVNPDCGLKTRAWPETRAALETMVAAARELRRGLTAA